MKMLDNDRRPSKSVVRRVQQMPNHERIYVHSEIDYKTYLAALKADFLERLKEVNPSPKTGLDGYELYRTIGTGAFGRVKIAKEINTTNLYAVKIMKKSRIFHKNKVRHIITEKNLLSAFRFPFVLWLEWSRKDADALYIGMPLLCGGELFQLHTRWGRFTEDQARFYAAQICLALEYLHNLRVIYRDLKLENVVIGDDGYIRLTDFGFAKHVADRTSSLCGTPDYLAPEIIRSIPYFSGPDWWALGVSIYEMVYGYTPFENSSHNIMKMYKRIVVGFYHMPIRFSDSLKDLLRQMLQVDFTKRLGCLCDGAGDVKRHSWFTTVNWCSYLAKQIAPPYIPPVRFSLDGLSEMSSLRKSSYSHYSQEFNEF